jgi:hypothetical protein
MTAFSLIKQLEIPNTKDPEPPPFNKPRFPSELFFITACSTHEIESQTSPDHTTNRLNPPVNYVPHAMCSVTELLISEINKNDPTPNN